MNAQQRKETYESNMRVIGYYYNTLKNNYEDMRIEDFNELSEGINRLLQSASMNLSIREIEIEDLTLPRNQSEANVTTTRGSQMIDLSGHDDLPMTLSELEDEPDDTDSQEEDNSSVYFMDDQEYQDYISIKNKPTLKTKCFSNKVGREKKCECVICCEEYSLHNVLTFGCGHEFCKECVCDHFHHSVENQPYKKFYSCPICRADVKQVRVNYSKLNAKSKEELMCGQLVTEMKTWCK